MWILLVLFYGTAKGVRDACKKKALEKNSLVEVIFLYTALSLLLATPFAGPVFEIDPSCLVWIFVKSAVIFGAWTLNFFAVSHMPISLYGVMDMSGVLFTVAFGVLILDETLVWYQWIGLSLVLAGLLLVGLTRKQKEGNAVKVSVLLMMLVSCLLNSVSGVMDKLLMRTGTLTSGQLQFWYMLFLTLMYLVFVLVRRVPVHVRSLKNNPWIVIMAVLFVFSDRALFMANADPLSKVTVMTILKQSAGIVNVLIGKWFFHETNITKRMLCAAVILAGIALSVW